MSSRFMKGAMILSLSMFFARLLGLLYVVPFEALVGPAGMALYTYAYAPYGLFLTLSTLGIPIGIAKFIAKYNADEEYDTSRRMFRLGMLFMVILGLICFVIMWFGAPWLASRALSTAEGTYNSHEDVIWVIRTVSFAVIVVPPMSILRGFFQGNQDMMPTAISQLIEQVVRVVLIVVGALVVVVLIPNGTTRLAVSVAVFAAFVSGVVSMYVLYRQWLKRKAGFDALLKKTVPHPRQPVTSLFKELLSYALPFAILSLVANWFLMIDMMTFNDGMLRAGVEGSQAEMIFGMYGTSLSKIVMIPVSFAIAFGQPLVTEVTEKIRKNDTKGVQKTLSTAILLTSFVTVPAVVGMALLSNPIYVMLFNRNEEINAMGGALFGVGAFIGFFLAFNSIIAAIIQGIGRHYKALIYLVIASAIKLVGNIVLIPALEANGAILATIIAYGFCIIMNYLEIRKTTGIQTRLIIKRHISILLFAGAMAIAVWLMMFVLDLFLDYTTSRGQASIYVLIAGIVGVIVYGGLVVYFDVAKSLFGDKLSYKSIRARIRGSKS